MTRHIILGLGARHFYNQLRSTTPNASITKVRITRHHDGEIVTGYDGCVENCDVTIIDGMGAPVHDHMMALLDTIGQLRHGEAKSITLILTYMGYLRSQTPHHPILDAIFSQNIDDIFIIDPHDTDYLNTHFPHVHSVSSAPLFSKIIKNSNIETPNDTIIISPDIGGTSRARGLAHFAQCAFGILNKNRVNKTTSWHGEPLNIHGKTCYIVDDIYDSGQTLRQATEFLSQNGAKDIHAIVTHIMGCNEDFNTINDCGISNIYASDTLPWCKNPQNLTRPPYNKPNIEIPSCFPLIWELLHK